MNIFFKKYCIPAFVLFLAIFLFMVLISGSTNFVAVNIGIALGAAVVLSFIVGLITYYLYEIWLPKTRKSLLTQTPFKELLTDGFTENNNQVYKVINGHTIWVSFEKESYKYIKIMALFNPELGNRSYTKAETDHIFKPYDTHTWYQNKVLWWGNGLVYYQIPFGFSPPKYQVIQKRVDELVTMLLKEKLKPNL